MSKFQIGDTVAPGWPAGRGRRGRIAALLENNKFQIDWADGTTGKVRGDQLLPVQSAQPETLETEQKLESVQSTQDEKELLRKVYLNLPDCDVWVTLEEMVQGLGFEYAAPLVEEALCMLEEQGNARRSLIGNEVVWQKDVNVGAQVQQEPHSSLQKSSPSTTFAQEWDSVLQPPPQSLENLNSSDSVKLTSTVGASSASDTPVFRLQETSELETTLQGLQQELQQLRSRVNHSLSEGNGVAQKTSETSSPTSLRESIQSNQTISSLPMPQESSAVHTSQEEPPEDFLDGFSGSFPSGGMVFNGKLSTQPSLALPSLESGSFWLRSPQILSSSSGETRPPGQSKLETQLKELGLIGPQFVINPEFLSRGLYSLPVNWASKLERKAATEILGISAKPTETPLTPALLPSPLATSRELKRPKESLQHDEGVQSAQADSPSFTWKGSGQYWIKPEWVKLDLGTQSRLLTDKSTINYYAGQMSADLWEWQASLVGLLWDGETLIPWDGHHRLEAAMAAGKSVLAQIEEGDLQMAIALSCGSNKKPSLRRTPEDNRKTIAMLEDLRKQHGDEWLLSIINADLPEDKQFKQLSLRALEAYTGIPFSTIRDVEKKIKEKKGESSARVTFTPSASDWDVLSAIMDSEGFEKPSDAIKWLIQEFQDS